MNIASVKWLAGVALLACALASCSKDTVEADPYADWEVRNANYLDSIANVCANPPASEKWKKVLNYKLAKNDLTSINTYSNSDYVYMKFLASGDESSLSPLYKDTVSVHYRGSLINGTVFDQSFSGDWNEDVALSTSFAANEVIVGWTIALQTMKVGDHVMLYIPQGMAYGETGSGSIRGYSTLIFDLRLEGFKHPVGPDDRSRAKAIKDEE